MKNEAMTCPQCDGQLQDTTVQKTTSFRDVEVSYEAPCQVCVACGLELASVDQAAEMQVRLADAYRRKVDLLDSQAIRALRKKLSLSQQAFADQLEIGVASIKRWENGGIQTKSMDTLMRSLLGELPCNIHTGHRDLSLPRVRLVLDIFGQKLGRPLIREDDRMLFAAKYVWYADMIAFRDHGQGMTGATYAALPYGPQLNNYRDLVDEIQKSNPADATPLTDDEDAIITAIAAAFPTDDSVFDASHREQIWQKRCPGELIPYTDAVDITEFTTS